MKEKDRKLREGRVEPSVAAPVPPVRGRAPPVTSATASAAAAAAPASAKSAKASTSAAAHTYDRSKEKWEKFDVDAALQEVDAPAVPLQPASASATPRPAPPAPEEPMGDPSQRVANAPLLSEDPAVASEQAKAAGNEAFKAADFGLAVTHYTTSLSAKPTAVVYANRAMARLKLRQHAEAEADCSQAIALDGQYMKAFQRRAAARRALGRLLPAVEDAEAALRLEPGSKVLRDERASLVREYQEAAKINPTALPVALHIRPLPAAAPSAPPPETAAAAPPPEAAPAEAPPAAARQASGDGAGRAAAQQRAPSSRPSSAAELAAARVAQRPLNMNPRTGTEFEQAWGRAAGDPQLQLQLLQALDPKKLSSLLKDSLTGPVLRAVLRAALGTLAAKARVREPLPRARRDGGRSLSICTHVQDVGEVVVLLQALQLVPRFSLAVLSLTVRHSAPQASALAPPS